MTTQGPQVGVQAAAYAVALAEPFKARTERLALSGRALARMIGVGARDYAEIQAGRRSPSVPFIASVIRAGIADNINGVAPISNERMHR